MEGSSDRERAKDNEQDDSQDKKMHGEGDHEADQRYRKRTKEFLETQEGGEASATPVKRSDAEKAEDKAAREKALKKARH